MSADAATIRPAIQGDAAELAELLGQLGYPASADEAARRAAALHASPGALLLVAELDERVAGLVTCHVFPAMHVTPIVAWLTALVVRDELRGRNIGQQLVTAAEEWARQNGAERMSLTSGTHREGAHRFYRNNGYEATGLRLTKLL